MNERRLQTAQYSAASISLGGVFIISRIPGINRYFRLSLYSLLALSVYSNAYLTSIYLVYQTNMRLKQHFTLDDFNQVVLKNMEIGELKRLYRSYQIKKAEVDADKKALAKYKYDPQSYH